MPGSTRTPRAIPPRGEFHFRLQLVRKPLHDTVPGRAVVDRTALFITDHDVLRAADFLRRVHGEVERLPRVKARLAINQQPQPAAVLPTAARGGPGRGKP